MKTTKKTFRNLRTFNLIMGLFHLIQGILMVAISNNTTANITNTFLTFDPKTETFGEVTRLFWSLPLGYAVSAFLFISAIAHFTLGTVAYDWYVKNLKQGVNYARWYEYALSSSWMIVIIAILTGIYDAAALLALFGVNASMIFFGLLMEKMNLGTDKKDVDWTAFIYGCMAGIIPWIILFWQFYDSINLADGDVPDFVYGIIISLFLFFNVFAINMYIQYKQIGPWKNYLYGERMYIILSLVAKSALAWQVFSGTLRDGN